MARDKGIPSQESVPHQVRFPHEDSCNEDILGTSRPTDSAADGFPGSFPIPKPRTKPEIFFAGGEFNHQSHTNGKKE